VHFQPTADQRAIQAAIREVCERRDGRPSWRELSEVGVFDLRRSRRDGGAGFGIADAVLVFEELGRALVPGPLIGTHLATTHLDGLDGARVGLLDRDQWPALVEHPGQLDVLVVLDGDGLWCLDPGALPTEPVAEPVDPLTPLSLVPELPRGQSLAGPDEAKRWRQEGAVLTAGLQLGIAERVVDAAVGYAKQREQFGRPIGSFQAVKHLLADMMVRAEVARAAVYAGAVTLDDPEVGDVRVAVATAKLMADEAAGANAKDNVQVHGGMGFTWEADAHLYLKRAWVLATSFGTADDHRTALAGML
jgi:alkylation response protein AidB-like acyl-CoA dehydrogenase